MSLGSASGSNRELLEMKSRAGSNLDSHLSQKVMKLRSTYASACEQRRSMARANTALVQLLAKRLGVAKSRMSLVSGATARNKVVEIKGISTSEAKNWLNHS